MITERINEVWDKIFFGGAGFNDFFLVFDDDFGVGDFDNFVAMNGKFGINEAFKGRAFDDNLLDDEIFGCGSKVGNMTEFATFFGFDLEADEVEMKFEDFLDFDDVFGADKLVFAINNHAE